MTELLRTALYDNHLAAGGRIVPFAGWDMPVQYKGVIDEVRAVREDWGVFDVSHMGQLLVDGPGATAALNRIVSADWSQVGHGRVAYALLLNNEGGVIDDIMGYRVAEDSWLIVANASRAEVDEAHLRANLPENIGLCNRYEDQAMLAVQGPAAEAKLAELFPEIDWAGMKWRDFISTSSDCESGGGCEFIARGGYTGCDGYEIMCSAERGREIWNALLQAGCTPTGLAARDALRLEAGLPLYGHELREDWTPYQSASGFAVKLDKGDFIGRDALQDKTKPESRIRALRIEGRAIPRDGYTIAQNGQEIGTITSGGFSPTLGAGIAFALLPATVNIGDSVDIIVRNAPHPAQVVKPPFVANSRKA